MILVVFCEWSAVYDTKKGERMEGKDSEGKREGYRGEVRLSEEGSEYELDEWGKWKKDRGELYCKYPYYSCFIDF